MSMIERMMADIRAYHFLKLVVTLLLSALLLLLILLRPPETEVTANTYLPVLTSGSLPTAQIITPTIELSPVVSVTPEVEGLAESVPTLILPERAFVGREVSLTGRGIPDSPLQILMNGQVLSQIQVASDGQWLYKTTFNESGAQQLRVESLDQGGLVIASSEPALLKVAVAPTLNLPEKASVTSDVILNGTGQVGSPLQLLIDGQVVSLNQVAEDGQWSASTRFDEPREYQVSVQALDENGTVLVASETEVLLVTVATPTLNVPIGISAGSDLSLNGTGEPDSLLEIMINGQVVGSTTVNGDGQWSYSTTVNQAGELNVTVQTLNRNGTVVATSVIAGLSVAEAGTEVPASTEVASAEPAPTEVPAEAPIEAPIEAPTEAPAEAPIEAPTEVPPEAPTEAPAEAPTEAPVVEAATAAPTEVPTEAPTTVPTEVPTEAPTEVPAEAATAVPSEERVLTLWHALPDEQSALLQQIADEWAAQQEGVRVQLEAPEELAQALRVASAEGETRPALAFVHLSDTLQYTEANLLLPLDSKVSEETSELADYYPEFLESIRDPKAPLDNQLMAWPIHRYQTVLFMNNTRALEVGGQLPPTSWEMLKEACVAHLEEGGESCWAATPNATTALLLVASRNGTILDETGQEVTFEAPLEEALGWIEELRALNGVYEATEEEAIVAFTEGKTLFTFESTQAIPDYEAEINSAFEMLVFPAPSTGDTPVTVATGGNVAIFRSDSDTEALAWQFLKYWTSTESNARWADALGAVPVRRSALETLMTQSPDSNQKKAAEWLPYVHVEPLIRPQIEDALTEAMMNTILGVQTPAEAANQAANKANDYLKE